MIALFLSIICSTFLVICFKYFDRFGIENLHAIVFNYMTCVITGCLFSRQLPAYRIWIHEDWFFYAAFLGCCFFGIFNVMAYVTTHSGITVTSVASKLSMVIPVTVAVILYHQSFTQVKWIALLLAVAAVILTSDRGKKEGASVFEWAGMLLALVIFIGSGVNDSIVNYAAVKFLQSNEFDAFNITIFSFAALSGTLVLIFERIFTKRPLPPKAIAGGVVLGIPNYLSLLFLLQALSIPGWESSVIFPLNNMGIVVLSVALAWLLFREKLSKLNWMGITLALIAIGLLIWNRNN